mmetsp:Transcript_36703/g.104435  ORF Transcript_36703/g.104435 Transcript_36703/m.104435 type:complete len:203 (+) Transcript_36703:142-750(+)
METAQVWDYMASWARRVTSSQAATSARTSRPKSSKEAVLPRTYASSKAATPGRTLPSKSSNEAPPPVLQCETLSTVLYFLQAVAVSPPPMTVMTPAAVAATTVSIKDLVPFSNLGISKTPMGPFQMMVFDSITALAFSSMDLGPQSKPMKPSGMPSSFVASLISPSSPNLLEMMKSTGKMISTPSLAAFSMISGTILAPSGS